MSEKKLLKAMGIVVVLLSLLLSQSYGLAGEKKEIKKNFKNVKEIRIQTISGDCVITRGEAQEVKVHLIYKADGDSYNPKFQQDGEKLVLREKYYGSDSCDALWKITAPSKTAIKYSSVSGNFSVKGISQDINAKTVSGDISASDCESNLELSSVSGDMEFENLKGDINMRNVSGEIEMEKISGTLEIKSASSDIKAVDLDGNISIKVASGDIDISNSKGEFKVITASGDIEALKIVITASSSFKVASGDVEVVLAKSSGYDLSLASASGNVVLNYNGNPIKGWFEFTALQEDGEIISPINFEKEEVEEKWGKKYDVKSFAKGGNKPKVYIKTASGKAVLKEK
jgi:hypothetical protein